MAEWGEWTEEDQKRVDQQYAFIGEELKRLVAEGADPASPESQAIAKLQCDLIFQFTKGDPDIEAGLKTWWQNYNSLPIVPWSEEESAFLNKAVQIFKSQQKD